MSVTDSDMDVGSVCSYGCMVVDRAGFVCCNC